jgi:FKBP-type peptidyl-prolyl cis-trans isomerase
MADAGKVFLEENSKKEGVTTTASGLQYKVIQPGTGARPKATDTVNVHYKGTFLDGKTFDSSYDRGQPISFPLNGVIAGWTEGVQLMPVGATYEFYIPSHLAYGERGAGGVIPPNSTLIFVVELLGIQ